MIYADCAATTRIDYAVLNKMMPYLKEYYGNASSPYSLGYKSREAVEEAREKCAESIGADPSEIYFTSGASEANNWLMKSFGCVLTTPIEHHSIINSLPELWGFVDVDSWGMVDSRDFKDKVPCGYTLSSIMMANNEIGTLQNIPLLASISHDYGVAFHTDATQAFGHVPIDVNKMGIDFLSMSGHKIHAPKGCGFLYVSKGHEILLKNLINGGLQEQGLRAGTENVAAIVGLGTACEIANAELKQNVRYVGKLRDELWDRLKDNPRIHLNGAPIDSNHRVESNLNIRIDGINASQLVAFLDMEGILISSGSACDTDSHEISHVLQAIGLMDDEAESSIRITLDKYNTEYEIIKISDTINEFIYMMG